MRRRAFLRVVGGASAFWPVAALGQQSAIQTVGFLRSTFAKPFAHIVLAFKEGLKEEGFREGGNVAIEHTPARPGDYGGKRVSLDKAERLMGWSPSTDFDEGMRRTFSWYVATYGAGSARTATQPSAS